jgi:glycosyltransferase involved in cell wall biosynthesis
MQISVVIPSYNRLDSLKRAIQSVLIQDSAIDELIVVDDGSTDNTQSYVKKHFPQVNLIHQPNLGVSAARNTGIQQAKYDWIAFLDSDDSWHQSKISSIREACSSHPDIGLFHSDEVWVRNGVRVNAMNKHQKFGGNIFLQCLPLCVISPSAVVLKRSLIESTGYFDESLPACEDYDLWLKICCQHPVHYIDRPLITKYGGHDDQLSTRFWGMDRFRIRALNRLIQQGNLSEAHCHAANAVMQQKLTILLNGARKHNNLAVLDEFSRLVDDDHAAQQVANPC